MTYDEKRLRPGEYWPASVLPDFCAHCGRARDRPKLVSHDCRRCGASYRVLHEPGAIGLTPDHCPDCSGLGKTQSDAERYRQGFICAMVLLWRENPDFALIPGLKAFAASTIEGFDDADTMRDVLLRAIGNDEALSALASGWDLTTNGSGIENP